MDQKIVKVNQIEFDKKRYWINTEKGSKIGRLRKGNSCLKNKLCRSKNKVINWTAKCGGWVL
jgi:hypothetical protein